MDTTLRSLTELLIEYHSENTVTTKQLADVKKRILVEAAERIAEIRSFASPVAEVVHFDDKNIRYIVRPQHTEIVKHSTISIRSGVAYLKSNWYGPLSIKLDTLLSGELLNEVKKQSVRWMITYGPTTYGQLEAKAISKLNEVARIAKWAENNGIVLVAHSAVRAYNELV